MQDPLVITDAQWAKIRAKAKELGSDGCTLVTQAFADCCALHDICYRTGVNPLTHLPISRAEADRLFRDAMFTKSRLGRRSPVAWVRYAGVRLFGRFFQ